MVDGKCRGFVEEIRRLIIVEINYASNAKISTISLGANKTFFVLDDNGDGIVKLLKNEHME
jgi:hypothetical protein